RAARSARRTAVTVSAAVLAPPPAVRDKRSRSIWRDLTGPVTARVGVLILAVVALVALVTPFVNVPDPLALSSDTYSPPLADHLFGTDNLGRDVLSAVMWGARVSLVFGVVVAAISAAVGTVAGVIPGYFGGVLDDVFSRFFEIFLSIPSLVLIVVVVSLFGTNILITMLVVGL